MSNPSFNQPSVKLKPRTLWLAAHIYDALFTFAFALAGFHLLFIRRNPAVLLLCGLPPAFALSARRSARSRPSSKLVAGLFLSLISMGDFMGYVLPQLGRLFPDLPQYEAEVLGWYVVAYLGFALVIFPPVLFIRPLIDHHHRRATYFCRLTCYLGLSVWVVVGPATCVLIPVILSR